MDAWLLAGCCIAVGWLASSWLWPLRGRLIGRCRSLLGRVVPRYPVLLAHGLLGFDEIMIGGQRHTYFRGIAEHLRAQGVEVHVACVDPSSEIAQRAAQLAAQVRAIPARRVNIIAHSMGGLDARYAIAKLGLSDRVAALITIGTPHRGTPLADQGMTWIGERLGVRALLRSLGFEVGAFDNLTTSHLTAFNADVLDDSRVFYGSVVGKANTKANTHRLLRPIQKVLGHWSGDNDGLVPVSSQAWGRVLLRVNACHLAQIGWLSNYDPAAIFDPLVRELSLEGC